MTYYKELTEPKEIQERTTHQPITMIFLLSLQRRGEESGEMEQISIIERFPYPFQVRYFLSPALRGTCNVIIKDGMWVKGQYTKSQETKIEVDKETVLRNETGMI